MFASEHRGRFEDERVRIADRDRVIDLHGESNARTSARASSIHSPAAGKDRVSFASIGAIGGRSFGIRASRKAGRALQAASAPRYRHDSIRLSFPTTQH